MQKGDALLQSRAKNKPSGSVVPSDTVPQLIQSVEKAVLVFECLCQADSPMRIAELSRLLRMNKTTVFRILQTYRALGYVAQDRDTDRYSPTLKLTAFSNMVLNRVELRSIARDVLRDLSREVQQSVHLSMRDRDEVVVIDKVEGPSPTRISFHIGRRSPMHLTGTGKLMLADLPDAEIEAYIARTGLAPKTPASISSRDVFFEEIQRIRANGVAYDKGENDPEVSCVAAPVRDYSGRVIACMSIVGAITRVANPPEELVLITQAANAVSSRMGFSPRT